MCSSRSRSRYSVSAAYLLKPGKAATQVVDCTLLTLKQAVPSLGMCRGGDLIAPLLPQSTKDLVYCWFIAADRSSRATTATCCLLVLLSFLHILPVCRLGSSSKKKQAPSQAAIIPLSLQLVVPGQAKKRLLSEAPLSQQLCIIL